MMQFLFSIYFIINLYYKLLIQISNHYSLYIIKYFIHRFNSEVFTINDKTIFTFGGGYSTDRAYRKEGVSWWKGELPTHEEVNYALQSLEKYNTHVDIILTHDAPRDIKEYLGFYNLCDMSVYGEEYEDIHSTLYFFKKNIVFQDWYLGHYHIDKDIGNMHILYNEIIEITDKE